MTLRRKFVALLGVTALGFLVLALVPSRKPEPLWVDTPNLRVDTPNLRVDTPNQLASTERGVGAHSTPRVPSSGESKDLQRSIEELQKRYQYPLGALADRCGPQTWDMLAALMPYTMEQSRKDVIAQSLIYQRDHHFESLQALLDWYKGMTPKGRMLFFGPWYGQTMVDAVQAGTLRDYQRKAATLSAEDMDLLAIFPQALPYLFACDAPSLRRVIHRDGALALGALTILDTENNSQGIERFVWALERWGARKILRIIEGNEVYGPALALLFARGEGPGGEGVPIFLMELGEKENFPEAFSLATAFGERIQLAAVNGHLERVQERALELLRQVGKNPDMLGLYLESIHTLDLACENYPSDRWGMDLLLNSGPMAAVLVYEFLGNPFLETKKGEWAMRPHEFSQRLGLEILLSTRDSQEEHHRLLSEIIRVGEKESLLKLLTYEELVGSREGSRLFPLVKPWLKLEGNQLADAVRGKAGMELKHILEDLQPETPTQRVLDCVPLYPACSAFYDLVDGRTLGLGALAFAVLDAASVVPAFGVVGQTVGKGSKAIMTAAKGVGRARSIGKSGIQQSTEGVVKKATGGSVINIFKEVTKDLTRKTALDVTTSARFLSDLGKKVGIKTTGSLDPRSIMRRDREVVLIFDWYKASEIMKIELIGNVGLESVWVILERSVR